MSRRWTFLTNHAHVLVAVAGSPDARVDDIAAAVGITPRAALAILDDLEEAGYLHRTRVGRRNHYTVHAGRPFRHPGLAHHDVDELLAIFGDLAVAGPAPAGTGPQPTSRSSSTSAGSPGSVPDARRRS